MKWINPVRIWYTARCRAGYHPLEGYSFRANQTGFSLGPGKCCICGAEGPEIDGDQCNPTHRLWPLYFALMLLPMICSSYYGRMILPPILTIAAAVHFLDLNGAP